MKATLLVFLGGGLGSVLRYWVSLLIKYLVTTKLDILGTFTVNILGSFLIGLLIGWLMKSETPHPNFQFFLIIGFCGGFTTFSTFSFDNMMLLKNSFYTQFIIYSLGSLVLGILAVFAGMVLVKRGF